MRKSVKTHYFVPTMTRPQIAFKILGNPNPENWRLPH